MTELLENRLFEVPKVAPSDLIGRFGIPPLTVFDRRQGYWQTRRRAWLDLGIDSGKGRSADLAYNNGTATGTDQNTSVFDPVIAETMVRWYSPANGVALDPFAGGSVRGIVSHTLGRAYYGVEIRPEQIEANEQQFDAFIAEHQMAGTTTPCEWILGDGTDPAFVGALPSADVVLTCPPYGDLEVYSDLAADISTMPWREFEAAYRKAVTASLDKLRDDRFSVWVVGNYRDKRTGHLRDLVGLTVDAHADAGASYHSEIVVVDASATGALRASATFAARRRPIRIHQTVLVFVKGDVRLAAAACEAFSEASPATAWWSASKPRHP